MKRLNIQPGSLRNLMLFLVICISLFLYFYTQRIIGQLREETRSIVSFYARMHAKIIEIEDELLLGFIFDEVISKTNFPLIQTDKDLEPAAWRGVSVAEDDTTIASRIKLRGMVAGMAGESEPIPMMYKNDVIGYLVHGDSKLIKQLQLLPYIEVGVVGFFILVGFIGYASIKRSEQRHIWVGMAKETAHQLGTPLSSLLGWVEVMQSGNKIDRKEIIAEMEKDIRRLNQVSKRFSQIGSRPDLKVQPMAPVMKEIVEYISRRVPQAGKRVEIETSFDESVSAAVNPSLFQWAVENIMKNSLDALDKDPGRIHVTLKEEKGGERLSIEIRDNGRGMDAKTRKRIFKPGYSTKERGWGLGLTLARRIIEEYHGGRMIVKESRPGVGTEMRIDMKI